jgi:hypothetical protein
MRSQEMQGSAKYRLQIKNGYATIGEVSNGIQIV